MAKRTDIKKILIIGSGPIVIGQAAEFDYAGTQACLALKEEGYEVVLCNSNPATIMTDTAIADKVYMEPLTLEYMARILRCERPDAIVPGIGGQTGLNLAMQLEREGILKECRVELLGTGSESIERAEDRELFKELCRSIGEPTIPSRITYSLDEAKAAAREIGYPVVLRPGFTLGGTGGGFANNEEELAATGLNAFKLSPVHQVLVEKSVKGYKEIEFEVMRDTEDHAITICGMENVDPVGVHTGDSIVVAPIMTLNDHDLKMLRDSALKIIRALKIEGGCNVQFALAPNSGEYYLIEVNPRVSRSSALASKASGYPIAKVTAKIVSCYADIIAMRHPKEGAPYVASLNASIPVINAGDGGHNHPTQTLADLLTIYREKGRLDHLTIGLCGDLKYGRTVHSLLEAMSRYEGIKVVLISPEELKLPSYVKKGVLVEKGVEYIQTTSLEEAIPELDILYMTRIQRERFSSEEEYFRLKDSYILTPEKMEAARPDMCVLHPLPRVNEISVAVDSDPRACYFKQALYGKYMRMALILKLLEEADKPEIPEQDNGIYLKNVIKCRNSRCITTTEQELDHVFKLVNPEHDLYRCIYCETKEKYHG